MRGGSSYRHKSNGRSIGRGTGVSEDRRRRERSGRLAEIMAALLLMAKGYRIVQRRHRSRAGEIDIIAVRGRRLAFVEVKARRSFEEAQASLADHQVRRIWDAAEAFVWHHPRYRGFTLGFDAILVIPRRLPRHLPDALQPV